jgi:hypothetical protein
MAATSSVYRGWVIEFEHSRDSGHEVPSNLKPIQMSFNPFCTEPRGHDDLFIGPQEPIYGF